MAKLYPYLIAGLLLPALAASGQESPQSVTLPLPKKVVVAHRGASSYLPEHTLAGYAMAAAQGADLIEPDVILTKDRALVCLHDLYLESTTDAATKFPGRARADGHWYAADFTLAEIKTLLVRGRGTAADVALPEFRVPTLDELILLVKQINRTTKGKVGLLIETKSPAFHLKEGMPLEPPLMAALEKHGYRGPADGVVIQSFDGDHLKRLRFEHKTQIPLMYLISVPLTDAAVDEAATYAYGVNPNRRVLEDAAGKPAGQAFLKRIRERGLKIYVWTFNAEDDAMRRFLDTYGVDGVITNNPDAGARTVRALSPN